MARAPASRYPLAHRAAGSDIWSNLLAPWEGRVPRSLDGLGPRCQELGLPRYLPDLMALDRACNRVRRSRAQIPKDPAGLELNPTLEILESDWDLTGFLSGTDGEGTPPPLPGSDRVLVWKHPEDRKVYLRPATDRDLLALKSAAEGLRPERVAAEGKVPVGQIDHILYEAIDQGLLIPPAPRLRRDPSHFPIPEDTPDWLLTCRYFGIQWHITNACDLHCKHCYDRTKLSALPLDKAIGLLDDLRSFCRKNWVRGDVTLTGGNPFLYKRFVDLYRACAERGLPTSILGNPVPRAQVEEVLAIQPLDYFQVSLEGLPDHNDHIRGPGHFDRTLGFLAVLKDLGVYTNVMLTLTRDNIDQVLPLAEILEQHTDRFTFNRLSQVGEGANLALPTPERYRAFLDDHLEAYYRLRVLGQKDNLLNVLRHLEGRPLFGGCTGFGCGAGFNFLVVLPDGEAHACRKFPSPLGNVIEQGVEAVYHSEAAVRYRSGPAACRDCELRVACGGCMAVVHGMGLDELKEKDPYCFL